MSDFFQLEVEEQSTRLTALAINALNAWGVTNCAPRLIKYRENAVFEVHTKDGARAALRVHRQGYHDEESLRSELTWMAMLAKSGLNVPTPITTEHGTLVVDGTAEGVPGVWKVDMLAWVEGTELGAIGEPLALANRDTHTLFFDIGKTMAQLHTYSSTWPEQNAQHRQAWDKDGFVGEQPLWGEFWDLAALTAEQKDLFLRAKAAIAEDLDDYGKTAENYGLIHADLVPENIMLNGDQIVLIDFDDAGFGWHMFEIATALHWLREEPEFETIQQAMIEGYTRVRALSARDLAALEVFFAARSLTYLGWVHTRRQTETAIELTPIMIEIAEALCGDYLAARQS